MNAIKSVVKKTTRRPRNFPIAKETREGLQAKKLTEDCNFSSAVITVQKKHAFGVATHWTARPPRTTYTAKRGNLVLEQSDRKSFAKQLKDISRYVDNAQSVCNKLEYL